MNFRPAKQSESTSLASRISVGELILALLLGIHFTFLPWAWGTMHPWAQFTSLGLAAAGFLLGFGLNAVPFYADTIQPRWKKVVLFPPFGIALLFIGLIATQALNPAWRYIEFDGMFWMVQIDHVRWLPTGMETPFERMNAFRHLIFWASAFLTMLTICLFVSSARLLRLILILIVVNGFILAGIGFVQILTEADRILWIRATPTENFLASFIYRNHGAAYFNLTLATSIALYLFCRERGWKSIARRKAEASPFFFFAALTIFTLIVFSQSRAGATVAIAIGATGFIYTLIHGFLWGRLKETAAIVSLYVLLFAVFTGTFVQILGWGRVTDRFSRLLDDNGQIEWSVRSQGYKATWEMFRDKPLFGWGAGSFEYYFPVYQAQYPEIHMRGKTRMIWEYAHNDPLQSLAEYGITGFSIILILFLLAIIGIVRNGGLRKAIPFWCLIAGLATIAHSNVDFVFHNPAILITVVALLSIGYRYAFLETQRRRYRPPAELSADPEPAV